MKRKGLFACVCFALLNLTSCGSFVSRHWTLHPNLEWESFFEQMGKGEPEFFVKEHYGKSSWKEYPAQVCPLETLERIAQLEHGRPIFYLGPKEYEKGAFQKITIFSHSQVVNQRLYLVLWSCSDTLYVRRATENTNEWSNSFAGYQITSEDFHPIFLELLSAGLGSAEEGSATSVQSQ